MAGGKKLPELDALTMAYHAVQQGAAGVDMGRNIFQSEAPAAMLRAVRQVVHDDMTPAQAFEVYERLLADPVRTSGGRIAHSDSPRTPAN
jgi:putative autoinducer-2 (AI-2) aldolase